MIREIFIGLIIVAVMFVRPALAEPVSLNALIAEALTNNPQIQAAKHRYEAAKARVTLTRSLADPEIEYGYDKITADMDAVMKGKTAPMRTFSVSQEIPFPTKLFLRKQAAQKEANSFEQEYRETERKVIKEVKDAYFQLFLNNKKIEITKESLAFLQQFVAVVNKKVAVNKATPTDALKAQVEHSKLSNALVLLEQEKKIAASRMNLLLNRDQNAEIEPREGEDDKNLSFEEKNILNLATDNRPELKSFQEMLKKAGIDLALAKQDYLPDFTLKYTREERDGGVGSWAGMVGVSVPLWFGGKQNSFVKEAQANAAVAKAEYQATENMVLFEVRSALAKFEAARSLVNIYETGVLPQAQAALETASRGYQSDQTAFLDLLDSQRSLREFQMEYFESLANLEMALADLERSVGTELGP